MISTRITPGEASPGAKLDDRVAVTYLGMGEYMRYNQSTFQVEWFFDGRIRFTYLRLDAPDGLVGLSRGGGVPEGFGESDFTGYPGCGPMLDLALPLSANEGDGVLAGQGAVWLSAPLATNLVVGLTCRVAFWLGALTGAGAAHLGVKLVAGSPREVINSASVTRKEAECFTANNTATASVAVWPTVNISDAAVREGHTGVAEAEFAVTLSCLIAEPVVVYYDVQNGSAQAGIDFNVTPGPLLIPSGHTNALLRFQAGWAPARWPISGCRWHFSWAAPP